MTNNFKKLLVAGSTALTTTVTFAQLNAPVIPPSASGNTGSNVGTGLRNIVLTFKDLALGVYSSIFLVAFIIFFGVIIFKFLIKGGDPTSRQEGFKYLGFGLVALFVMFGVMGIIAWISTNLGVGLGGDLPTPGVPSTVRPY